MLRWIINTFRASQARKRAQGKAWAEAAIRREGVDAVEADVQADLAMSWGYRPWEEGALDAIREARAAD